MFESAMWRFKKCGRKRAQYDGGENRFAGIGLLLRISANAIRSYDWKTSAFGQKRAHSWKFVFIDNESVFSRC